ncbi:MAG: phenylalanine--tRNA ligase subunit alpha [bacterium]
MEQQLKTLKEAALKAINAAQSEESLGEAETKYLGRKGELSGLMRGLGALAPEDRKKMGELVNSIKSELEAAFVSQNTKLKAGASNLIAEAEWMDVTAPGVAHELGHSHIITKATREIEAIFSRIGFVREKGFEADWDHYAFEALNMPHDHPARNETETFFVGPREGEIATDKKYGKMVLTPHTSNSQVRLLERGEFPIRAVCIGKAFRRESNISHIPMFHQFEGFCVDKNMNLANLKGVIDYFIKSFFGTDRKTRLRPHHFRFTEPSFEVDISCVICGGTGLKNGVKCGVCKRGWLELGGAGMTHPNVLKAGGVDPEKYSAFAFGFGVERCYMMKEGLSVPDLRMLYKNDFRFLKQL